MKIFNRKAQAATEFIMTYGWAILVVLAAIGALAYFGVLSPDKFLPERCTFPSGIDCIDKAVITASSGDVQLALKNNIGYSMNVTGVITVTDDCTLNATPGGVNLLAVNGVTFVPANGAVILNNGQATLLVDCGDTKATGRFKSDLTISYTNLETFLSHRATGNIRGRAT